MVEPDYQTWREYAYKENMHPAILSYLELRNNCFYRMETTIDGKQFATPRGWEDLSRMMEVCEQLGKDITEALVIQYILYLVLLLILNSLSMVLRQQLVFQKELLQRLKR